MCTLQEGHPLSGALANLPSVLWSRWRAPPGSLAEPLHGAQLRRGLVQPLARSLLLLAAPQRRLAVRQRATATAAVHRRGRLRRQVRNDAVGSPVWRHWV